MPPQLQKGKCSSMFIMAKRPRQVHINQAAQPRGDGRVTKSKKSQKQRLTDQAKATIEKRLADHDKSHDRFDEDVTVELRFEASGSSDGVLALMLAGHAIPEDATVEEIKRASVIAFAKPLEDVFGDLWPENPVKSFCKRILILADATHGSQKKALDYVEGAIEKRMCQEAREMKVNNIPSAGRPDAARRSMTGSIQVDNKMRAY